MKNKKVYVVFASLILFVFLFSACAPEAAAPGEQPTNTAAAEQLKVIFMTEDPIGVNPYFITAQDGLKRAETDFNLVTKVVEGTSDPTTTEENLRAAAREDWDLYILMTFGFTDVLNEVAPQYPDKIFVCVDCAVDQPNVLNVDFKTQEAAYLLGIAGGLITKTNVVGNIGPVEMPFMTRWTKSFADAAEFINPDVTVLPTLWVGDWADPATAKELALTLADQGADVINGVAAAGNPGVFEAAQEKNFLTTGVDINECPKAPGYIIDSTLKRVDNAVYSIVQDKLNGTLSGGFVAYGLADGGVDLAVFAFPDEDTQCVLKDYPDVMKKVGEVRQQIIDGTLVIPDPMTAQ